MVARQFAAVLGMGLLVGVAAACSAEKPAATAVVTPHVLAATQLPIATSAAVDTPAPPASATAGLLQIQTPTASPTPSETPAPTEPPPCTDNLTFITDLTIPDGTQFLPGQAMDKQWLVRNSGDCDWDSDYRVVLVSGSGMGPRSELALFPARAGADATIQIGMQAPPEPGEHIGRWQARSPEGRLFGNVVFIKIVVIPLPEPPPPDSE